MKICKLTIGKSPLAVRVLKKLGKMISDLQGAVESLFSSKNASASMKQQLIVLLTTLSILPILIMGGVTYFKAQNTVQAAQESMLSAHAQGISRSIDSVLSGANESLKVLASQSNILILLEDVNFDGIINDRPLMNGTSLSLKNTVKGSDKLYESLFIADLKGKVVVEGTLEKTSMVGTSILDTDYYHQIAAKEKFVVGEPFISKTSGRLVIPIARSIETLAGRNGTLVALFDHLRFMDFLKTTEIGKSGAVYILDAKGNTIYPPGPVMPVADSPLLLMRSEN